MDSDSDHPLSGRLSLHSSISDYISEEEDETGTGEPNSSFIPNSSGASSVASEVPERLVLGEYGYKDNDYSSDLSEDEILAREMRKRSQIGAKRRRLPVRAEAVYCPYHHVDRPLDYTRKATTAPVRPRKRVLDLIRFEQLSYIQLSELLSLAGPLVSEKKKLEMSPPFDPLPELPRVGDDSTTPEEIATFLRICALNMYRRDRPPSVRELRCLLAARLVTNHRRRARAALCGTSDGDFSPRQRGTVLPLVGHGDACDIHAAAGTLDTGMMDLALVVAEGEMLRPKFMRGLNALLNSCRNNPGHTIAAHRSFDAFIVDLIEYLFEGKKDEILKDKNVHNSDAAGEIIISEDFCALAAASLMKLIVLRRDVKDIILLCEVMMKGKDSRPVNKKLYREIMTGWEDALLREFPIRQFLEFPGLTETFYADKETSSMCGSISKYGCGCIFSLSIGNLLVAENISSNDVFGICKGERERTVLLFTRSGTFLLTVLRKGGGRLKKLVGGAILSASVRSVSDNGDRYIVLQTEDDWEVVINRTDGKVVSQEKLKNSYIAVAATNCVGTSCLKKPLCFTTTDTPLSESQDADGVSAHLIPTFVARPQRALCLARLGGKKREFYPPLSLNVPFCIRFEVSFDLFLDSQLLGGARAENSNLNYSHGIYESALDADQDLEESMSIFSFFSSTLVRELIGISVSVLTPRAYGHDSVATRCCRLSCRLAGCGTVNFTVHGMFDRWTRCVVKATCRGDTAEWTLTANGVRYDTAPVHCLSFPQGAGNVLFLHKGSISGYMARFSFSQVVRPSSTARQDFYDEQTFISESDQDEAISSEVKGFTSNSIEEIYERSGSLPRAPITAFDAIRTGSSAAVPTRITQVCIPMEEGLGCALSDTVSGSHWFMMSTNLDEVSPLPWVDAPVFGRIYEESPPLTWTPASGEEYSAISNGSEVLLRQEKIATWFSATDGTILEQRPLQGKRWHKKFMCYDVKSQCAISFDRENKYLTLHAIPSRKTLLADEPEGFTSLINNGCDESSSQNVFGFSSLCISVYLSLTYAHPALPSMGICNSEEAIFICDKINQDFSWEASKSFSTHVALAVLLELLFSFFRRPSRGIDGVTQQLVNKAWTVVKRLGRVFIDGKDKHPALVELVRQLGEAVAARECPSLETLNCLKLELNELKKNGLKAFSVSSSLFSEKRLLGAMYWAEQHATEDLMQCFVPELVIEAVKLTIETPFSPKESCSDSDTDIQEDSLKYILPTGVPATKNTGKNRDNLILLRRAALSGICSVLQIHTAEATTAVLNICLSILKRVFDGRYMDNEIPPAHVVIIRELLYPTLHAIDSRYSDLQCVFLIKKIVDNLKYFCSANRGSNSSDKSRVEQVTFTEKRRIHCPPLCTRMSVNLHAGYAHSAIFSLRCNGKRRPSVSISVLTPGFAFEVGQEPSTPVVANVIESSSEDGELRLTQRDGKDEPEQSFPFNEGGSFLIQFSPFSGSEDQEQSASKALTDSATLLVSLKVRVPLLKSKGWEHELYDCANDLLVDICLRLLVGNTREENSDGLSLNAIRSVLRGGLSSMSNKNDNLFETALPPEIPVCEEVREEILAFAKGKEVHTSDVWLRTLRDRPEVRYIERILRPLIAVLALHIPVSTYRPLGSVVSPMVGMGTGSVSFASASNYVSPIPRDPYNASVGSALNAGVPGDGSFAISPWSELKEHLWSVYVLFVREYKLRSFAALAQNPEASQRLLEREMFLLTQITPNLGLKPVSCSDNLNAAQGVTAQHGGGSHRNGSEKYAVSATQAPTEIRRSSSSLYTNQNNAGSSNNNLAITASANTALSPMKQRFPSPRGTSTSWYVDSATHAGGSVNMMNLISSRASSHSSFPSVYSTSTMAKPGLGSHALLSCRGEQVAADLIDFLLEAQDPSATSMSVVKNALEKRTLRAQQCLEVYRELLGVESGLSPGVALLYCRSAAPVPADSAGSTGDGEETLAEGGLQSYYGCGVRLEDALRSTMVKIVSTELEKLFHSIASDAQGSFAASHTERFPGWSLGKQKLVMAALLCFPWSQSDLSFLDKNITFDFLHQLFNVRHPSDLTAGCGLLDLTARSVVQQNSVLPAKGVTVIEGEGVVAIQVDNEEAQISARNSWYLSGQRNAHIFYFETLFDYCITSSFFFKIGLSERTRRDGGKKESVSYSSTGEMNFNSRKTPIAQTSRQGDTLGCGVIVANRQIFFTRNGEYLCGATWDSCVDLIPFVFVDSKHTTCRVQMNFGASRSFMFDFTRMHISSLLRAPTVAMLQDAALLTLQYIVSTCHARLGLIFNGAKSDSAVSVGAAGTPADMRRICTSLLTRSATFAATIVNFLLKADDVEATVSESTTPYSIRDIDRILLRHVSHVIDIITQCYSYTEVEPFKPLGSEFAPLLISAEALLKMLDVSDNECTNLALDSFRLIHETLSPERLTILYDEIWSRFYEPKTVFQRLIDLATSSQPMDHHISWDSLGGEATASSVQRSFCGQDPLPTDQGIIAVGFKVSRDSTIAFQPSGSSLGGCYYVGLSHTKDKIMDFGDILRRKNDFYVLQDTDDKDQLSTLLWRPGEIPHHNGSGSAQTVYGSNDIMWVELDPVRREVIFYRNSFYLGVGFEDVDISRPLYPYCFLYNDNASCELMSGVTRLSFCVNPRKVLRSKAIGMLQYLLCNGGKTPVWNFIENSLSKNSELGANDAVTALAILGGERDFSHCLHATYGNVRVINFINTKTCSVIVDGTREVLEMEAEQLTPQSYKMPMLADAELCSEVVDFITKYLLNKIFSLTVLAPLFEREKMQRSRIEFFCQRASLALDRELVALKNISTSAARSGGELRQLQTFARRLSEGVSHPSPYVTVFRPPSGELVVSGNNPVVYSFLGHKRKVSLVIALPTLGSFKVALTTDTTLNSLDVNLPGSTSHIDCRRSESFMFTEVRIPDWVILGIKPEADRTEVGSSLSTVPLVGVRVDIVFDFTAGCFVTFVGSHSTGFKDGNCKCSTKILSSRFSSGDRVWLLLSAPKGSAAVFVNPEAEDEGFPVRDTVKANPADVLSSSAHLGPCALCHAPSTVYSLKEANEVSQVTLCSTCFSRWFFPSYSFAEQLKIPELGEMYLTSMYSPQQLHEGDFVEVYDVPIVGWEQSDSVNVVCDPHLALSVRPNAFIISDSFSSLSTMRCDFSFSSLLHRPCSRLTDSEKLTLTWRGASSNSLHPESLDVPEGNLTRFSGQLPHHASSFWFGVTIETYECTSIVYVGLVTNPTSTATSLMELEAELAVENPKKWAVKGEVSPFFSTQDSQSVWSQQNGYYTTYFNYDSLTETLYCAGDLMSLYERPSIVSKNVSRHEPLYFFLFTTKPCGATLLPGMAAARLPAGPVVPQTGTLFFALIPHSMPVERIPPQLFFSPSVSQGVKNGWRVESGFSGGEFFCSGERISLVATHGPEARLLVYVEGALVASRAMNEYLEKGPLVLVAALPNVGFCVRAEVPVDSRRMIGRVTRAFSEGVAAVRVCGLAEKEEMWVRSHDTRLVVRAARSDESFPQNTPIAILGKEGRNVAIRATLLYGSSPEFIVRLNDAPARTRLVNAKTTWIFNLARLEDFDCPLVGVPLIVGNTRGDSHKLVLTRFQNEKFSQCKSRGVMFDVRASRRVLIKTLRFEPGVRGEEILVQVFYTLNRFSEAGDISTKWHKVYTGNVHSAKETFDVVLDPPVLLPAGQFCAFYILVDDTYGVRTWLGIKPGEAVDLDGILTVYDGRRTDSSALFRGVLPGSVFPEGMIEYETIGEYEEPYCPLIVKSRSAVRRPTEAKLTVCRPLRTCTAAACIFTISCDYPQLLTSITFPVMGKEGSTALRHLPLVNLYHSAADITPSVLQNPSTEAFQSDDWRWAHSALVLIDDVESEISLRLSDVLLAAGKNYIGASIFDSSVSLVVCASPSYVVKGKDVVISGFAGIVETAPDLDAQPLEAHVFTPGQSYSQNQIQSYNGIMFDIRTTADVIVDKIKCISPLTLSEVQCTLFCREGGMRDAINDSLEWKEVCRSSFSAKEYVPFDVLSGPSIVLKKGTRYGIYIQTNKTSGIAFYTRREGLTTDIYKDFDGDDCIKVAAGVVSTGTVPFQDMQMNQVAGFRGELYYRCREGPKMRRCVMSLKETYIMSKLMRCLAAMAQAQISIPNVETLVSSIYQFTASNPVAFTPEEVEDRLALALEQANLVSQTPVSLNQCTLSLPTERWHTFNRGDIAVSTEMNMVHVSDSILRHEAGTAGLLPLHRVLGTDRPLLLPPLQPQPVDASRITAEVPASSMSECSDMVEVDLPDMDDDWLLKLLTNFIETSDRRLPAEQIAERLIRREEVFDTKTHKVQRKVKAEECLVGISGSQNIFKVPVSALLSPAAVTVTTPLLRQSNGTLLGLQFRKQRPSMGILLDVVTSTSCEALEGEVRAEDITVSVLHAGLDNSIVHRVVTQVVQYSDGLTEFPTTLVLGEGQCSTIADEAGYVVLHVSSTPSTVPAMLQVHEMPMRCWSFVSTGIPAAELAVGTADELLADCDSLIKKPAREFVIERIMEDGAASSIPVKTTTSNARHLVLRLSIGDVPACEFQIGEAKLSIIVSVTAEKGVQVFRTVDGQPTLWCTVMIIPEVESSHIRFKVVSPTGAVFDENMRLKIFSLEYTPKDNFSIIDGLIRWKEPIHSSAVAIEDDGARAVYKAQSATRSPAEIARGGEWVLATPMVCKTEFTVTLYKSEKRIGEYLGGDNCVGIVMTGYDCHKLSLQDALGSPYMWLTSDIIPSEDRKNPTASADLNTVDSTGHAESKNNKPQLRRGDFENEDKPMFVSGTALRFIMDPKAHSFSVQSDDGDFVTLCTDLPENIIFNPVVRLGTPGTYAVISRSATSLEITRRNALLKPFAAAESSFPRMRYLLSLISDEARSVFQELWNTQFITATQPVVQRQLTQNMHLTKRMYSFDVLCRYLDEYGVFEEGTDVKVDPSDISSDVVYAFESVMRPRPVLYISLPLNREIVSPSLISCRDTLQFSVLGSDTSYPTSDCFVVQVPENVLVLGCAGAHSTDLVVRVFTASSILDAMMRCLPCTLKNFYIPAQESRASITEHQCIMSFLQESTIARPGYRCLITQGRTTHRLDEIINENIWLPFETIYHIITGLLCALEHYHLHGVAMGCVVAENIYVNLNNIEAPELLLWGCYSRREYTDPYCPPETFLRGEYTIASDAWSAAVISLELLTEDYIMPVPESVILRKGPNGPIKEKVVYEEILTNSSDENGRIKIDRAPEIWGTSKNLFSERMSLVNDLSGMLAVDPAHRSTISETLTIINKGGDDATPPLARVFRTGQRLRRGRGSHNGIMFDIIAKRHTVQICGITFTSDSTLLHGNVTAWCSLDGFADKENDRAQWREVYNHIASFRPNETCSLNFSDPIEISPHRRMGFFLHTNCSGGVQFFSEIDGATAALSQVQEENAEIAVTTGRKWQNPNPFHPMGPSAKRYFKGDILYNVVLPKEPRRSPLHSMGNANKSLTPSLAPRGARFTIKGNTVISLGVTLPRKGSPMVLVCRSPCIIDSVSGSPRQLKGRQSANCDGTTPRSLLWVPLKALQPSSEPVIGFVPSTPIAPFCMFHKLSNKGYWPLLEPLPCPIFCDNLPLLQSELYEHLGIRYFTAPLLHSGVVTLRMAHPTEVFLLASPSVECSKDANEGFELSGAEGGSPDYASLNNVIAHVPACENELELIINFELGFVYDKNHSRAIALNVKAEGGIRVCTDELLLSCQHTYATTTQPVALLSRRILQLTVPPFCTGKTVETVTPCRKRLRAFWDDPLTIVLMVGTLDDDDEYVVYTTAMDHEQSGTFDNTQENEVSTGTEETPQVTPVCSSCTGMHRSLSAGSLSLSTGGNIKLKTHCSGVVCRYGVPKHITVTSNHVHGDAKITEIPKKLIIQLPDEPDGETPAAPEVLGQSASIEEIDAVTIQQISGTLGDNDLEFNPLIGEGEQHTIMLRVQAPREGKIIFLLARSGEQPIDWFTITRSDAPGSYLNSASFFSLYMNVDAIAHTARVECCDSNFNISFSEVVIIGGVRLRVKMLMLGALVTVESWTSYNLATQRSLQTDLWEEVRETFGRLPSPHYIRGPGFVTRHSNRRPKLGHLPSESTSGTHALEETLQHYAPVAAASLLKALLLSSADISAHTVIITIAALPRVQQRPAAEHLINLMPHIAHLELLSEVITLLSVPEASNSTVLEAALHILDASIPTLVKYVSENNAFAVTLYTLLFRAATQLTRHRRHTAIRTICSLTEKVSAIPPPSFFCQISHPLMAMAHSLFHQQRSSPLCYLSLRLISSVYDHYSRVLNQRLTVDSLPGHGSDINFPVVLFASDIAKALRSGRHLPLAMRYVEKQELKRVEPSAAELERVRKGKLEPDICFTQNCIAHSGVRIAGFTIREVEKLSTPCIVGWEYIDEGSQRIEWFALKISSSGAQIECSVESDTFPISLGGMWERSTIYALMRCDYGAPLLSFILLNETGEAPYVTYVKPPPVTSVECFLTPFFRNLPSNRDDASLGVIYQMNDSIKLRGGKFAVGAVGLMDPLVESVHAPIEHMQHPDAVDTTCQPQPIQFYRECAGLFDKIFLKAENTDLNGAFPQKMRQRDLITFPRLYDFITGSQQTSKSALSAESIAIASSRGNGVETAESVPSDSLVSESDEEELIDIQRLEPYVKKISSIDFLLPQLWKLVDLTSDGCDPSLIVWSTIKSVASHKGREGIAKSALELVSNNESTTQTPEQVIIDLMRAQPSMRKSAETTLGTSIFFQLYTQLNEIPISAFTKSPLFKVTLLGLGAVDAGGPYRDVLSKLAEEMMRLHPSKRFLCNPLFQKCGEDGFFIMPAPMQGNIEQQASMLVFFGKLLGFFLLKEDILSVDFPSLFWHILLGEELSIELLLELDRSYRDILPEELRKLEQSGLLEDSFPGLADKLEAIRSGNLDISEAELYERLSAAVVHDALHAYDEPIRHIRSGLQEVVPLITLRSLYVTDVERMICGVPEVSFEEFYNCCEIAGLDVTSANLFKNVIRNFTSAERSQLMQFITGQRRPPLRQQMKVRLDRTRSMGYPSSSTCFSQLILPKYNDEETMRNKLLYAIKNAVMIDMDTAAPQTMLTTPDF